MRKYFFLFGLVYKGFFERITSKVLTRRGEALLCRDENIFPPYSSLTLTAINIDWIVKTRP